MFDILKEILVNKLKVPAGEITAEATPQDIDLDSLATVELAIVLEKELGIGITEDELLNAGTIGAMAGLMADRSVTA